MSKRDYPKQDEAQALIEWTNAVNEVYLSSCDISEVFQRKFKRADKIRQSLYKRVFGVSSPWSVKVTKTKNRKLAFYWNDDKAKKLGLG